MKPDYERLWNDLKALISKEVKSFDSTWIAKTEYRIGIASTYRELLILMEANEKTSKEEYICRKCGHGLDYHEWNCVVDGEETGETYKVVACEHCGQIEDIEEYKGILNLTEMRQMGKELKAWLNE